MRLETPFQIAAVVGVAVAVLLAAVQVFLLPSAPLWWLMASESAAGGLAAFGVTWFTTHRYLDQKISLLYRSIQATELQKASRGRRRNALAEAQRNVAAWASGKQSEIQLLQTQAQFRRDFIGNLAHELKTPLFNLQGYLHTLLEGGLEDPKINYDYLNKADNNLDRLITLVEDLDNISKLESGRAGLKFEKFNVVELVHDVFVMSEISASDKGVHLQFNKKYERPIMVKADRARMQQVFTNLIQNAINYGRMGGYCEVRFLDMPQTILVEVADDGMGVKPEDLPRLFERFFRTDKSRARNQGGTGLGLAIVKHIIEGHEQSINVRSVFEQGTTFSFTIERAR